MREKIAGLVRDLTIRLAASLKRFPEALLLAFSIVVLLIYINHNPVPENSPLIRTALALSLGIPLILCIKMAWERMAAPRLTIAIAYVLAALALFLYYSFLLNEVNMVSMSRHVGLNVALYLLFLSIPFLGRQEGFELYVIKLFTGFIATYFYSLILFAGLAAILFTINTLFSANISENVYFDLWLITAGIFAPAYFLAGIPAFGEALDMEDYPKFLRVLLLYIVMPLLTVYTGILYVYFIKILATRNWPSGMVSNLVLWYSFISIAVVFLIYLLKEKNNWARMFETYLPKLILPLLMMMFVAMGIRITAYGITENRYLVMTGGIWVAGCMLYCAFKAKRLHIWMVISAAIITVLTVSGPWSCYEFSKNSQNARFEKALSENNMLVDGKIVPRPEISTADKQTISSIIQYFNNNHELKELNYLPLDFKLSDMDKTFGFGLTYDRDMHFNHSLEESGELHDIRNYDYYLPLRDTLNPPPSEQGALQVSFDQSSRILTLSREDQVLYQKDISAAAQDIHTAHTGDFDLDSQAMTFVDENENVKIMLLFTNISGSEDGGDGKPQIEWIDFSLFLKLK